MDTLLNDFQNFSLWLISKENLQKVSSFILRVNNQVHMNSNIIIYKDFVKTREIDNDSFSTSHFYAIKNRKHEIVGTIKAQKWDRQSPLPIEHDFNIKVADIVSNLNCYPNEIWHIGRFAIDQEKVKKDQFLRKNRLTLLKLLLANAFQHIYTNPSNIALAECDKKLFEKLKLLQINSTPIGESKTYLGSETVPIYNTSSGVEKNKHLCYTPEQQDLHSA